MCDIPSLILSFKLLWSVVCRKSKLCISKPMALDLCQASEHYHVYSLLRETILCTDVDWQDMTMDHSFLHQNVSSLSPNTVYICCHTQKQLSTFYSYLCWCKVRVIRPHLIKQFFFRTYIALCHGTLETCSWNTEVS